MRDALLVGPILVVGGFLLDSLSRATSRHESMHAQELFFLGFLFVLLYAWYRGKQMAAERLRALELGRALPEPMAFWPAGKVVATVGVGGPVGLTALVWAVNSYPSRDPTSVWLAIALLGMTALVCGMIVLLKLPPAWSTGRPSDQHTLLSKPVTDPDAFDVVAQRGSNGPYPEERS